MYLIQNLKTNYLTFIIIYIEGKYNIHTVLILISVNISRMKNIIIEHFLLAHMHLDSPVSNI